jgi:IPT/TIG domain
MRLTGLLLAILFTAGCGAGDPKTMFSTSFSPPALMELSPNTAPVNSPPFTITVNGANFTADAVVFWNGVPQSTRFLSSSQLLVTLTDTDLMTFGLIQVFVRTAGLNSNTVDFNVTAE